jgi:group II intron reverse transcriptase/maturase
VERVRQAAESSRTARFTALLHHVSVESLRAAYVRLRPDAAAGVDGMTKEHYGRDLEANLQRLHGLVHRGAYRPKPAKRVYITKEDGSRRPLAVGALEDKIVQLAVAQVLGAIFEADFAGFSYGFRPGRSQHDALNALAVGITWRKVNWIVDLDIQSFFDSIEHERLMSWLEIRIADPRILRLIRRWLEAGVLEEGKLVRSEKGTPQGAPISPLLANVFLHYVFDAWASTWRKRAQGDMVLVRYADDIVAGFQHRWEAERFLRELRDQLAEHGLALHPEKTRLLEFGRFAVPNREARGEGKPESFTFLGLTHSCGRSQAGKFVLLRRTVKKRLRAKLKTVKQQLRRRMHASIPEQGAWLRSVVVGYFNYHAVPTNYAALAAFRRQVARLWLQTLRRRGQKHRLPWSRMARRLDRWLPRPRVLYPWPSPAALRHHPRQEPSAVVPLAGI